MEPALAQLVDVLDAWVELSDAGASTSDADVGAERAIRALGVLGRRATPAVPALIRVMHADPRGLGQVAGRMLGEIGGERAIRELNRAWLSGWDRKLCDACYEALSHLGERAHPLLWTIASEGAVDERVKAFFSLRAAACPEPRLAALAATMLAEAPVYLVDALIDVVAGFEDHAAVTLVLPALLAIAADDRHYFSETRRRAANAAGSLCSRPGRA